MTKKNKIEQTYVAVVKKDADGDYELVKVYDEPNRPVFNIMFRNPDSDERARAATVFTNKWCSLNLSPNFKDEEGDYGRQMPLKAAALAQEKKQGFLNVYPVLPKED